ncbi:unnamed protein product [Pleuronectes platessa]|uniref:GLTSCR protein conserved domain-containing protein n=1 Tax=Pleuronectes platessa TaxID=8262 RepID=A0A9N7TV19_PLEPL|nr:unnamed protein product [Pleuronectes platessa]
MDDEDDRHLLDILGDVDALNDYLHGNNSKSIEEDDVTNAAYGSDGSFFAGDTPGSNSGLKDGSSSMGGFGADSAGAGLQLSSSLSFIEDELGSGNSSGGVDLGGEDQPFDILQKSLMEADITEQTLAQEALLDSQPAPTLVQAPVPFQSQLVSGGYGGGVGMVTTATAGFPTGQFLQGVSQLPNGSAQHIQVLGSFGAGGGMMTLSSLRPGAPVAAAGATTGGQVFAPTQGQVGLPYKNIPLQNIIIQRGPGGTQTLVRPIQPKPLQAGTQTVYSLGLQPTSTTMANANSATSGGHYTANGSIVVQQSMEQQQAQTNLQPGQYLLPSSLALAPGSNLHNGPSDPQLKCPNYQSECGADCGRTELHRTTEGSVYPESGTGHHESGWRVCDPNMDRRYLFDHGTCADVMCPWAADPGGPGGGMQEQDFRQNSSSPALKQPGNIHVMRTMTQDSTLNSQVSAQKRPAHPPLTREGMILQRLGKDHAGVQTLDRRRFTSISDALQRLLPYHVFQGAPPSQEEFSQVDDEFEAVATQVLKRTQAMVNKYRRLLLVEAERSSPSSEMVMIDRTFNQEERTNLTQDKRMVLVDQDSFLEDFCCGMKSRLSPEPVPAPAPAPPPSSCSWNPSDSGSTEPPSRTDSQPGCGDPGGGGAAGAEAADRLPPPHLENKSALELKRSQQRFEPSGGGNNSCPPGNASPPAAKSGGQTHYQGSHQLSSQQTPPQFPSQPTSPPHTDTDSALEAAVNSILEC